MDNACRHDQALPLGERGLPATREVDQEYARRHQKEFVGVPVLVPALFALEHR